MHSGNLSIKEGIIMKLFLMRHAHTQQSTTQSDFERILTEQGNSEAREAASFLHTEHIDKMLVSYVKRTMQTADLIQEKVTISEIEVITELYDGNQEDVLGLLCTQDDRYKNILVIGHNPLIYNLSLQLADNESPEFEFLSHSSMPPARVVVIDFPTINSWKNLKNHKGTIIKIFTPSL